MATVTDRGSKSVVLFSTVNAKVHGLKEIFNRLDRRTYPLPTGNDVANILKWFQQTLQRYAVILSHENSVLLHLHVSSSQGVYSGCEVSERCMWRHKLKSKKPLGLEVNQTH